PTAEDNQPSVEIHVLQGEREMASYNKSLGKFQLTGIPPGPRGIPQIEVAFDIDANGILNVSAKDLGTGKEQKIEIKAGSGLSEEEIKRMVSDAESHAEEDRRARELAEARNNGENAAYQAEKQLGELGDQVDADSKQRIEAAIKDVRDSLESEDAGAINAKTEALQTAFHAISEAMYQRAQEQAAQSALQGDVDELVAVAAQRDDYLALAQRTQADFENYRKRVARESIAAQERGAVKLAQELLPALDNLDRALAEAGGEDGLRE